MARSCTARRTRSTSCSKENSGVWTPMTTRPSSRYACAHALSQGSVRSQLMQVRVQKSTRTTEPRSWAGSSGPEFSHAVAPLRDGRCTPADMGWLLAAPAVSAGAVRAGGCGLVQELAGHGRVGGRHEDPDALQLPLGFLTAGVVRGGERPDAVALQEADDQGRLGSAVHHRYPFGQSL